MRIILQLAEIMKIIETLIGHSISINSSKIFIDKNNDVKISLHNLYNNDIATKRFVSPEIMNKENNNDMNSMKPDVYSFSIIAYEIYFNKVAYVNTNLKLISETGIRPIIINDKICKNLAGLIKTCWQHAPKDRPSFHNIYTMLKTLENK